MSRTVLIAGTHALLAGTLADRYRVNAGDLVVLQGLQDKQMAAGLKVDDVWWLEDGPGDARSAADLLAALPALGACSFNLVRPAAGALGREPAGHCPAGGARSLVFHVPHLLGQELPADAAGQGQLLRFLHVFESVVTEVAERLPEYFRRQPLRCLAPAGATVGLAAAGEVADLLLSISRSAPHDQ